MKSLLLTSVLLLGQLLVSLASWANERPLPPVNELLQKLQTHQEEVERVRRNYIFTMEEDEQEAVKDGSLRVKMHNTYEVHYQGPWIVQTLVAQNGRQLTPEEIQKHASESDKDMRRARQSLAKIQSDPDAEGTNSLKLSDFLAADKFVNLRREHFRGQTVLAVDFVPNPEFRPRRNVEKVLKNLGGTVWIDEQEFRCIRLEARLLNNVSFGGFLASVKKGTAIIFEQKKVNNEIWLPSYAEIHLDARAFLSRKRVNLVQRFNNYRRFKVTTEIKPI